MNDIIAAILPESYEELKENLARVKGAVSTVQIDVCDGVFVRTRTWPMHGEDRAHFAALLRGDEGLPYWEDFNFEVDLMAHTPELHIPNWIAGGVSRAVVHLESKHDLHACRDAAGGTIELGLAIDLDPPWERIHASVPLVDYIQIMGIGRIGSQGQEPDDRVYALIKKVRAEFPDVTIQIDGGVSIGNARALLDAGADRLVVGSAILTSPHPKDAVKELQNA